MYMRGIPGTYKQTISKRMYVARQTVQKHLSYSPAQLPIACRNDIALVRGDALHKTVVCVGTLV